MKQEVQVLEQGHKFTRRQALRAAITIPAAAVLASCDSLYSNHIDRVISTFVNSDLINVEGWEGYRDPIVSCVLKVPPGWRKGASMQSVGNPQEQHISFTVNTEEKVSPIPRIDVFSRPALEGTTEKSLFQSQVDLAQRQRMEDIRVTNIKVNSVDSKMLSYVYKDRDFHRFSSRVEIQYHTVILARNGRELNITFIGNNPYRIGSSINIIQLMPVFKAVLASFKPID